MNLLQDEKYVIKWLSQYQALTVQQVVQLIGKPLSTAGKILRNLKQMGYIFDLPGGYLSLDPTARPDPKLIKAIWVLLRYRDEVDPMAHFPAAYPAQIFFLKGTVGYEIITLDPGEEHILRLLTPKKDTKYIIVLPERDMADRLFLPDAPCLFALVKESEGAEPAITFYGGKEYERSSV